MQQKPEKFGLHQINDVAKKILELTKDSRILAFYGSMGVGKTTLIKAICKELGVKDIVGSPTFSLVNQYLTYDNQILYHFDFYRMKKIEEAYDIGYEEYFYSGNYCFIEWPELIEEILPEEATKIHLSEDNEVRQFHIE